MRISDWSSDVCSSDLVLADLENGSTSLWLEVGTTGAASDLAAALDGVLLDLAPVVLDAPGDPVAAAEALAALFAERGVTPAEGINLGADPIGAQVRGEGAISLETLDVVAPNARDLDRKSTPLNLSHSCDSRLTSS